MTKTATSARAGSSSIVQLYIGASVAGLLLVVVVLLGRGVGSWSLIPLLIGGIGIAQRWRSAPIALAGTIVIAVSAEAAYYHAPSIDLSPPRFRLSDWLLGIGAMAFTIGHYRALGLVDTIFPLDPRKRESPTRKGFILRYWTSPPLRFPREPERAMPAETSWFFVLLPLFPLAAQVIWLTLPRPSHDWGLAPRTVRLLTLVWLAAIYTIASSAFLAYLRTWRMTVQEAQLYLQDQAWRETAREQRHIQRWKRKLDLKRSRKEKR